MITPSRLEQLHTDGWRITRDGSTATASLFWDDPDDSASGWELHVKHTDGHGARLSIVEAGLGLSERSPADARRFAVALSQAVELTGQWDGSVPDEW